MNEFAYKNEKINKIQRKLDIILPTLPKEFQDFIDSISNFAPSTQYNYCVSLKSFIQFIKQTNEEPFNCEMINNKNWLCYENDIRKKVNNREITLEAAKIKLNSIKRCIIYLYLNKIIPFKVTITKYDNELNTIESPKIVIGFIDYLRTRNYAQLNTYRKSCQYFLNFIEQEYKDFNFMLNNPERNIKRINSNHLRAYHNYLSKRLLLEEITIHRVNKLLQSLKLFMKYLNHENLNSLKYSIPEKFRCNGTRENEYATSDDVLDLIKQLANDKFSLRNTTIALILLDTGCRPIEICNLKIKDVLVTEKCLMLRSKKSGQRKLKLNTVVMNYLKSYLRIREKINIPSEKVFLNKSNNRLTPMCIYSFFRQGNIGLKSTKKITPKTLRHTYITNAIDNGSSLIDVAQVAGHKHLISTLHYLERSRKRLLNNTLPFEPYRKVDI